jgi:hypothetical protein
MSGVSPTLSKLTGSFFGSGGGGPSPGILKKQESSINLLGQIGGSIPSNTPT